MARGDGCDNNGATLAGALRGRRPKRTRTPQQEEAKERRIKKRVDEARVQLQEELERIDSDDALKAYLRLAARFPGYSARNNLILKSQRPDATIVFSQARWAKLERTIAPGAKPIRILVPRAFIRKEDPATGEEETIPVGYGTLSVYDVSDTVGQGPTPTPPPAPTPLTGTSPEADELVATCTRWCVKQGIRSAKGDLSGSSHRYDEDLKQIIVEQSLPRDERALAFCRATATAALERLPSRRNRDLNAAERALACEAAAYSIASSAGLEVEQASFPELARIATDGKRLEVVLDVSQRVAATVLDLRSDEANSTTP